MKKTQGIANLFKRSGALALILAVVVQYGFVSVKTVSCYSCEDKATIAELKSCCSHKAEKPADTCSIEDRCCSSSSESHSFFSINYETEEMSFDLIANRVSPILAGFWQFELIERLRDNNIHGPPLILNGASILKFICKYSL